MAESPIQDVSDTAFLVATYRAMETSRPDALFRDPLAERLAGDHGKKIVASLPGSFFGAWTVVVRTVIIDNFIASALSRGIDTVLNLGAGLDTRPYRMPLPESLRWIEVDYPRVIELKEQRLMGEPPRCRLDRVKMDLTDLPARRKLLAEMNSGSEGILVLTEGLVPYLSVEETATLADDLRAQDKARLWIVDYVSRQAIRYRQRQAHAGCMHNAPFRFDPPDWFGFFDQHGWKAQDIRYIADEANRLHRPIPLPRVLKIWMRIRALFASQERRDAFRKFAGYVLLEPK